MLVVNTSAGPVKICSVWDFIKDVKNEKIHPDILNQIRIARIKEYTSSPFRYNTGPSEGIMTTSEHILKTNPMFMLTELKKTTKKLNRKGKRVELIELLYETVRESQLEFGQPTHFFSIGSNRYALMSSEDVILFTGPDYKQTLVCMKPQRNFQIYAPNLKVVL